MVFAVCTRLSPVVFAVCTRLQFGEFPTSLCCCGVKVPHSEFTLVVVFRDYDVIRYNRKYNRSANLNDLCSHPRAYPQKDVRILPFGTCNSLFEKGSMFVLCSAFFGRVSLAVHSLHS